MTRMYVGNLPFSATQFDVRDFFKASCGELGAVDMVYDKETSRFKGFAFVDMNDDVVEDALALDGNELMGRPLVVNRAKSKRRANGW